MEVKTNSPRETQKIAEELAREITAGDVIALYGNLGAGKTVFVQGLARGLKIKRKIVSPTFVFMRSYPFNKGNTQLTFYHIDLYRGEQEKDFENLGLEEIFSPDSVVVLEWADRIKNVLPKKRIEVFLETINEKSRKIKIRRFK
jgi:tRNA threonylcarbamoyladenosine biosynthesis protein TsaE